LLEAASRIDERAAIGNGARPGGLSASALLAARFDPVLNPNSATGSTLGAMRGLRRPRFKTGGPITLNRPSNPDAPARKPTKKPEVRKAPVNCLLRFAFPNVSQLIAAKHAFRP
jgi:hypothetical protein